MREVEPTVEPITRLHLTGIQRELTVTTDAPTQEVVRAALATATGRPVPPPSADPAESSAGGSAGAPSPEEPASTGAPLVLHATGAGDGPWLLADTRRRDMATAPVIVASAGGSLHSVRRYTRRVYQWAARCPDLIVLGQGLLDCLPVQGRRAIELDDFTHRVTWILTTLVRDCGIPVVWVGQARAADADERVAHLGLRPASDGEDVEHGEAVADLPTGLDPAYLDIVERACAQTGARYLAPGQASADDLLSGVRRSRERADLADPVAGARALGVLERYLIDDEVTAIRSARVGMPLDRPGGRSAYETSRQRAICSLVRDQRVPGRPLVLAVGDSVFMRLNSTSGYVLPLYRRLMPVANVEHVPHHAGGTPSVVAHLDSWIDPVPDVAYLSVGLHDLTRLADGSRHPAHVPLQQFTANVRDIIGRLQARGTTVVWGLLTPVDMARYSTVLVRDAQDIAAYNAACVEVCQETGVRTVDLHTLLAPGGVQMHEGFQSDGGHLSPEGAELVAEAVAEAVIAALQERAGGR